MTHIDTHKPLFGKVAVVTGASRGIGCGIAERLAHDGASVIVNYARNAAAAQEVVEVITQRGGIACAVQADMGIMAHIHRLFEAAIGEYGALDILVNNAGTAEFGPIAEVTEEVYDRLFALNTKGVFFAMKEAAKWLEGNGRIINISSGITIQGSAGASVYAGTKAALEQFTLSAAKELGSRGITVNTVSPGFVVTDLLNGLMDGEAQAAVAKTATLGRIGYPKDIADVVAFLVSEQGGWISGQNIRATGGMS